MSQPITYLLVVLPLGLTDFLLVLEGFTPFNSIELFFDLLIFNTLLVLLISVFSGLKSCENLHVKA